MTKLTAILLAFAMIFTLAACGKTVEPEVKDPEPQVIETPEPVTEPDATEPAPTEPVTEEPELSWDDLVGTWYLKTCYLDENEVIEGDPGFWDAYENNTDARLTFTDTDGIDYYWETKYEVSEEYEDMPHETVNEPVSEEYDFADWCITAQSPYGNSYRIGFADENTLVCYETYGGADLGYESTLKLLYTKEGPIEFHKNVLDADYLTGYWYMNSVEVDGDYSYCIDSGNDCWIYFDGEGHADFYDGNIYFPEEAHMAEGCEYRVIDEPVLSWVDDSEYPDRQDWSVEVDIPMFYDDEEEYYQFGLTDDYTLTMYHEIVADGGSYHVGVVGQFSWYSPFEDDGYGEAQLPAYISDLVDNAGERQWMIAICDPDEELKAELDAGGWELNDMSYLYDWENPKELVLIPVGWDVELEVCTGEPVITNGEFEYWLKDECMYNPDVCAGTLWRGIVDMPDSVDDATLCLYMGFGSEGLNGGEEYFIRICDFFEEGEDPYLGF